MAKIEVFLWSTIVSGQLTSLHYSYDHHYYMEKHMRKNYHWLRDQGFSTGRIFAPDSAALLPVVAQVLDIFDEQVGIYDLNSIKGKLLAWRSGIRRAPSVKIGDRKYSGLVAARMVLMDVIENSNQI